jgi:hypothetical protein
MRFVGGKKPLGKEDSEDGGRIEGGASEGAGKNRGKFEGLDVDVACSSTTSTASLSTCGFARM